MAEGEKKPFLSGVSGTIAGVAALITAIGGLIGALAGLGVIGGGGKSSARNDNQSAVVVSKTDDWTSQANKLCAQTNDTINALPDPKTLNLKSGIAIGRQSVRISQQLFRDLAALPKPPDKAAQIDNFLRLGALVNQADAKLFDELKLGQIAAAVQAEHSLSKYGQKLDNAAIALGATTCAEGSSSLTTGLPGG
jgi:hypothetical protein